MCIIGRYAQKVGNMVMVIMWCLLVTCGIGSVVDMKHPHQTYLMMAIAIISGLYIGFDIVNTWTKWSKEAKEGGAIK
jgi:uncharacterized membrane protein